MSFDWLLGSALFVGHIAGEDVLQHRRLQGWPEEARLQWERQAGHRGGPGGGRERRTHRARGSRESCADKCIPPAGRADCKPTNTQNNAPQRCKQWPEGQIAKPKNVAMCKKKQAAHFVACFLHPWVLQSVPPAIVCIFGVHCFACLSVCIRPDLYGVVRAFRAVFLRTHRLVRCLVRVSLW